MQGGGAHGAYQAGVYAGLAETGETPDWIVGVSIGGINSAIIAGNVPERRVTRLREFWERVSSNSPVILPQSFDAMRPILNRASATSAMMLGIPGFYTPRLPPPFMAPDGTAGALSYYDTSPLKATLEELVDFDLINQKRVRLSLGAVNVRLEWRCGLSKEDRDVTARHRADFLAWIKPLNLETHCVSVEPRCPFHIDDGQFGHKPAWRSELAFRRHRTPRSSKRAIRNRSADLKTREE